VSTSKVRVWTPVPQVLVQVDQAFQEAAQSTGQGWVLQLLREMREGAEMPPWAAGVVMERVLEWIPPPHFPEQAPRADQLVALQSMGHAKR
jgi:hypothetical protein